MPTKISITSAVVTLVLAFCGMAGQAHATTNLLVNPGFETGDFTGWNIVRAYDNYGGYYYDDPYVIKYSALSGTYSAGFSSVDYPTGIYQTVNVIEGNTYYFGITFKCSGRCSAEPYQFYGGLSTDYIAVGGGGVGFYDSAPRNGQLRTFRGTFTANGPTATVSIGGFNTNGRYLLDDAYLGEDSAYVAVPEPATWALMIGGFTAAGAALRRKRGAVA